MGGSSKSGNSAGTELFDYRGGIAAALCLGPITGLAALLADGAEVWPKAAAWTDGEEVAEDDLRAYAGRTWQVKTGQGHTCAAGNAPPNATYWSLYYLAASSDSTSFEIEGYGSARLLKGSSSQTVDSLLQAANNDQDETHPDYKNVCVLVLDDFLWGRERQSAPNIEAVVIRKPEQSVITGDAAELIDGQANLIAFLAEAMTSPYCLGYDDAILDSTSWQAAADTAMANAGLCYGSPIYDSQVSFRQILSDVMAMADCYLRRNLDTGKIEIGIYAHGSAPEASTELAIDDLTEPTPKFRSEGLSNLKTRAVVSISDRLRAFKRSSEKATSLVARKRVGEDRTLTINRENYITRRAQAARYGAELLRTMGQPQLTGTVNVRREKGRAIRPGDYVGVDINLEPGGSTLVQQFRVSERTVPYRGSVELKLEADLLQMPVPHQADDAGSETPEVVAPDPIVNQRIIEAPSQLSLPDESILVLAERPSAMVTSVDVWFDMDTDGSFVRLGTSRGFATRATLRSDITGSATTIPISVPDQIDLQRLTNQPGALGAANDNLLCILVKQIVGGDDDGLIVENADGYPWVEVTSISAQSLVSAGNYDLTVLRGRLGTGGKAFTAAASEVWIIPRARLPAFAHPNFETVRANYNNGATPDLGYFRLLPANYAARRLLADCASIPMRFAVVSPLGPVLAMTTPTGRTVNISGSYPQDVTFTGTWSDPNGDVNGYQVNRWHWVSGAWAEPTSIYNASYNPRGSIDFSHDVEITSAGTWLVTLRAFDARGNMGRKYVKVIATV